VSFSYAPAAPASRDHVRLIIGDTNAAAFVFEDEELDMYLTTFGEIQLAAAQAIRTLAVNQAKQALYYSINGLTMDRRRVAPSLLEAAKQLEDAAFKTPWELESILDHYVTDDGQDLSSYADSPEIR
jgi:hypothetical protein